MSRFVLDTDVLVLFQEGHETVCRRVLSHSLSDLATTVITIEEQLSGWYTLLRRSKDAKQLSSAYQRLADNVQLLGTVPAVGSPLGLLPIQLAQHRRSLGSFSLKPLWTNASGCSLTLTIVKRLP